MGEGGMHRKELRGRLSELCEVDLASLEAMGRACVVKGSPHHGK